MNIKKHRINEELARDLHDFGFHIEPPRAKKANKPGNLISYDDCPCELLELIEVTEYRELWSVRFFDDSEPSFILL